MQTILVILLLLAFVSGAPLFTIMLGGAALGALSLVDGQRGFDANFDGMIVSMFGVGTGEQASVLSTLPLFIYAGYLLADSKSGDRLVRVGNAALGWLPGGLAIVAILTSALYTVFTGGSGVTIIALGGVLLPGLVKQGYPERFSLGLVAGTGAVGLLFPPAVPLFIFGTIYGLTNLDPENFSSGRFIFAGIVPGLVVLTLLSVVAVSVAIQKKLPRTKFTVKELVDSFIKALPELIIPFAVIVGLAKGFALSEVAALTVAYVVILEVGILRQLKLKQLWTISRESMAMVGAIFIIIFASTVMTNYLTTAKVPEHLVAWTQDHVHSKWVFLLALNAILLIVGTIMDVFSAIVIIVPLIAPIAKSYGVDPYHLGVIFLLNLEVGYLHPPVGLNLFITSVKFNKPITEVMWATVPFLVTMLVSLLIITYVPSLTVVPEAERRGTANNLITMVHEAGESARSVKSVPLVAADGTPLLTVDGKPSIRQLADCDKLLDDKGRPDENGKEKCKLLFFDVSTCRTTGGDIASCEHKAIASWVDTNLETLDVVLIDSVALVDAEGKPVTAANGPVTKKLTECAALTGMAKDTCRELFLNVTRCKLNPPDGQSVDECSKEKIGTWVTDNSDAEAPAPAEKPAP
jgi:C4-dicarboxylate transporter, DctM subunit